jgi:hypothetical protein
MWKNPHCSHKNHCQQFCKKVSLALLVGATISLKPKPRKTNLGPQANSAPSESRPQVEDFSLSFCQLCRATLHLCNTIAAHNHQSNAIIQQLMVLHMMSCPPSIWKSIACREFLSAAAMQCSKQNWCELNWEPLFIPFKADPN